LEPRDARSGPSIGWEQTTVGTVSDHAKKMHHGGSSGSRGAAPVVKGGLAIGRRCSRLRKRGHGGARRRAVGRRRSRRRKRVHSGALAPPAEDRICSVALTRCEGNFENTDPSDSPQNKEYLKCNFFHVQNWRPLSVTKLIVLHYKI
jgi:hypothetical protein